MVSFFFSPWLFEANSHPQRRYLATIDMAHDHFGFYLGWGSAVWLPVIYTSQAQYLSTHFVQLSPFACVAILATGIVGYILFRLANSQKDLLRRTKGKCQISGSKPRVVHAQYTTADGKVHQSLLLRSGMLYGYPKCIFGETDS